MSKKPEITIDEAYSVQTPADNIRLYGAWADTYDTFIANEHYVYHLRVAEILIQRLSLVNGPVLDVGCGTGIVGVCLQDGGIKVVDGVDISPQMLDQCRKKLTRDEEPAYRNMIQGDLTKTLAIADSVYAGLISAGTFTHGHLGAGSLDELWRLAAPGAPCVIGVNLKHYESMGFARKLSADVVNGTITEPELLEVDIYSPRAGNLEHGGDKAVVVVCQIV